MKVIHMTLILLFAILYQSKASDTIRIRGRHALDVGIIGRSYFGSNSFKYENFDDGLIQRLGSKRGAEPFPF
jgi:hypothetical protein